MKPAQHWILDVDANKAERLYIETESSTHTWEKPRKIVGCVILAMCLLQVYRSVPQLAGGHKYSKRHLGRVFLLLSCLCVDICEC